MKFVYTDRAANDLAALAHEYQKRVAEKMRFYEVQEDPLHFADHLTGFRSYRFRIGIYRLFCEISDDTLFILRIKKRDGAYRGLE
ncbi:MAG: type II toxin-antitoxin system RelE/ParE family toxin [bacterium]|nr:type II toxin-antitoxin system RelE/ParE family toxin [bacterium]